MQFTLRKKILLYSVLFSLAASAIIGFSLYNAARNLYVKNLILNKCALARALASGINGDKHASFTSEAALADPEYWRTLRYLTKVKEHEEYITYLYTLNYEWKTDALTYAFDSEISASEILWAESEDFALVFRAEPDGKMTTEYNQQVYPGDVEIAFRGRKLPLRITGSPLKTVSFGGVKLFDVLSYNPLTIRTKDGISGPGKRYLDLTVAVAGEPLRIHFTYSAKGEPGSIPGSEFVESKDYVERCKNYIRNRGTGVQESEVKGSIYGENLFTVYSAIMNAANQPVGLLIIDLYDKEIQRFCRSIMLVALAASIVTFILAIIFSFTLAEYLIRPIIKISSAVNKVAAGLLDVEVAVTRTDELGALATGFNSMTRSLREYTDNLRYLAALDHELGLARDIQKSILPHEIRPLPGIDIAARYIPMEKVGGDFYDFCVIDEQHVGVIIADVSGHGIPASLLASMIKIAYVVERPQLHRPGEVLVNLNGILKENLGRQFITASCVYIDLASSRLVVANAGHPPVYLVRSGSGTLEELNPEGQAIGFRRELRCESLDTALAPGDRIVLVTDGILEIRNGSGVMFDDAFRRIICESDSLSSGELCERVIESARHWGAGELDDDLTMIAITVR